LSGRISRNRLWIQPAAGDAGGAVGAAVAVWHISYGNERQLNGNCDATDGSYLGPDCSDKEIERVLQRFGAKARHYQEFHCLASDVARKLGEADIHFYKTRSRFSTIGTCSTLSKRIDEQSVIVTASALCNSTRPWLQPRFTFQGT
jgi:predicted NodU family carbamoyl transferase